MNEKTRLLQERLELKREAYSSGNLGALSDAFELCIQEEFELPDWVVSSIRSSLHDRIAGSASTGSSGRHARWIQQYRHDMKDLERNDTVQNCVENGIPKVDAYYAASRLLLNSFAAGAPDTIEKSVKRYKKVTKEQPLRYHVLETVRLPQQARIPSEIWQEVLAMRKNIPD